MNLADARTDFSVALSTVVDVRGHEYRPTTPREGDAWPLLGTMDRADASAFFVSWRVLVVLPQDERAASVWIDGHAGPLVDAIEGSVGFVDRLEPVEISTSAGGLLALQITVRGE